MFARIRNFLNRKLRGPVVAEFLRFATSSTVLQVSRTLSGLAVAALITPEDWGYWYLLSLIVAYGSLTQLGALNGMNREVPALLGAGSSERASTLRQTALGVVIASSGGALVLLLLGMALYQPALLTTAFCLTLVLLLSHQAYAYATTSLRATMHFRDLSRLQWFEVALYPLTAIGGTLAFGLNGFLVGQICTSLICCLLANQAQNVVWRPILDRPTSRRLIAIGFPIMLVGLTYTMLTTVDRWVIAGSLGQTALGHYSLAIMALSAVGFLPNVISQQFYPRIAYSWSSARSTRQLRALAGKQRILTFAVVVPIAAGVVLLAPVMIRTFLPHYTPGIPAVQLTAAVPIIATVGQGYGAVLHVLNRQYWYLCAIAVSLVIHVVASLWLVGPYGLMGVATGTLIAFAALAALRVLLGTVALRKAARDLPAGRPG